MILYILRKNYPNGNYRDLYFTTNEGEAYKKLEEAHMSKHLYADNCIGFSIEQIVPNGDEALKDFSSIMYVEDEALSFIEKETGYTKDVILKILNSEQDYMKNVGLSKEDEC